MMKCVGCMGLMYGSCDNRMMREMANANAKAALAWT